jgi:hypothetical protein
MGCKLRGGFALTAKWVAVNYAGNAVSIVQISPVDPLSEEYGCASQIVIFKYKINLK